MIQTAHIQLAIPLVLSLLCLAGCERDVSCSVGNCVSEFDFHPMRFKAGEMVYVTIKLSAEQSITERLYTEPLCGIKFDGYDLSRSEKIDHSELSCNPGDSSEVQIDSSNQYEISLPVDTRMEDGEVMFTFGRDSYFSFDAENQNVSVLYHADRSSSLFDSDDFIGSQGFTIQVRSDGETAELEVQKISNQR